MVLNVVIYVLYVLQGSVHKLCHLQISHFRPPPQPCLFFDRDFTSWSQEYFLSGQLLFFLYSIWTFWSLFCLLFTFLFNFCSIFVQFQFNLFFHIPLNFYQSDFGFLPNFYYVYFINRPPSLRRTHSLWMTPKGVGTKLIGSLTCSS